MLFISKNTKKNTYSNSIIIVFNLCFNILYIYNIIEISNGELMMADSTLDAKGLNCPLPILKAKKSIKSLEAGQTLEILATDPGAVRDFVSFCKATGNELMESDDDSNGVFRFVIKKATVT